VRPIASLTSRRLGRARVASVFGSEGSAPLSIPRSAARRRCLRLSPLTAIALLATLGATGSARGAGTGGLRLYPGGRILAGGGAGLARYHRDGSLDSTFGSGGRVPIPSVAAPVLTIDSSGRIVVAGIDSGGGSGVVARYKPDGSLDRTFGRNGRAPAFVGGAYDEVKAVAMDATGRIVVAGGVGPANSEPPTFAVTRFNASGSRDRTFGNGGDVSNPFGNDGPSSVANALAIDSQGRILAAGGTDLFHVSFSTTGFALARYNPDGSLDQSFGSGGKVTTVIGPNSEATGVAIDSQGRILTAGTTGPYPGSGFALARYNPDGTLDQSFGTGGTVTTGFPGGAATRGNALAIDTSGDAVVAGTSGGAFALARYTLQGNLDPSFGSGGGEVTTDVGEGSDEATAVAIDPSRRVIAAGGTGPRKQRLALARYTPTGALDSTFGRNGVVLTGFPPDTVILRANVLRGRHRARITFKVNALGPRARRFQCRLRSSKRTMPHFKSCRSPKVYTHLAPGRYRFEVRAVNSAGPDPTPAKSRFRIR
jgi:uncharacterized delta-60 repeat protein